MAEHVDDTGLLHGRHHGPSLGHAVGQRLLAQDSFTCTGSGDRDLGVAVAGRAHVHEVDVVTADDSAPVRGHLVPAEAAGRLLGRAFVAAAEHFHARHESRRQKRRHLPIGVAMGTAHEAVTDQRNADLELGHEVAPLLLLQVFKLRLELGSPGVPSGLSGRIVVSLA